jgi:GNAT superfamily N-acetyltransferase
MEPDNTSITCLPLNDALADGAIRNAIEKIANASYSNASVLLNQEYKKNNEIYVLRDSGQVYGFFMVGWSQIHCIDGFTVFLGLSCVDAALKGRGVGKRLYEAFFKDALSRQSSTGRGIIWWAHTATPAAVNGVARIATDFSPRPDGTYKEEHFLHLNCIKAQYGMTEYRCETHPFVLRAYAKARYGGNETARIKEFKVTQGYGDLLANLRIDETAGDRLMLVGEIKASASDSD